MIQIESSFHIHKKTPLVIYGASYIGTVTGAALLQNGFSLVCFVDQRADEIKKCLGLPVLSLQQLADEKTIVKENAVIIVAVKNVFYHEEIVSQLVKNGFHNILYKSASAISKTGDQSNLDRAYEAIYKNGNVLPLEIDCTDQKDPYYSDHSYLKIVGDQHKTILVPMELVFTGTTAETWSDICILALTPHIRLFEFFEGLPEGECDSYLQLCSLGAQNANVLITEAWKEYVLSNRKDIFTQMCKYLEFEPEFFIMNAPEASYNPKGYFNLHTGKHRAAFLAAKGHSYMPIKISNADFDQFFSKKRIDYFENYLESEAIEYVYAPILHPAYYSFKCENSVFFHQLAKRLIALIGEDRPLTPLKAVPIVADFFIDNGFISRIFKILGFEVIRFYEDHREEVLAKQLDKLANIDVTHKPMETDNKQKFDIVFYNANRCNKNLWKTICQMDFRILIAIVPKGSCLGRILFTGFLGKSQVDVVVIRGDEISKYAELGYRV